MSNSAQINVTLAGKDSVSKVMANVGANAHKLSGTMQQAFAFAGGLSLQHLGQEAVDFAKESVAKFGEVGGEVRKLQRVVGGSAEDVSKLRFAFHEVGIDVDGANTSLKKFSQQAASGGGKAFTNLGINVKDANGKMKGTTELLLETADVFKGMPDGIEKTSLAVKLFGKQGLNMLPFLNKGKEGISEFMGEAQKFGEVLSQDDLDATKAAALGARQFQAAIEGLQMVIGRTLLPVITAVTKGFTELATSPIFGPLFFGALAALAGIMLTAVVPSLLAGAAAGFAFIAPWLPVIAIVSVLALAISQNFLGIQDIIKAVFGVIQNIIGTVVDVIKGVVDFFLGVYSTIADVVSQIPGPWQDAAKGVHASLEDMRTSVKNFGKDAAKDTKTATQDATSAIKDGTDAYGVASVDMADQLPEAIQGAGSSAVAAVKKSVSDIIGGLKNSRGDIASGLKGLHDLLAGAMSPKKEIANLTKDLKSKDLAKALKSSDPIVRATAEQLQQQIKDRIYALQHGLEGVALQTGTDLTDVIAKSRANDLRIAQMNGNNSAMQALHTTTTINLDGRVLAQVVDSYLGGSANSFGRGRLSPNNQ